MSYGRVVACGVVVAVAVAVVAGVRQPHVQKMPVLSRHNPPNTGSAFITWVRIRRTSTSLLFIIFYIYIYICLFLP
jgi:hypothetical protein